MMLQVRRDTERGNKGRAECLLFGGKNREMQKKVDIDNIDTDIEKMGIALM